MQSRVAAYTNPTSIQYLSLLDKSGRMSPAPDVRTPSTSLAQMALIGSSLNLFCRRPANLEEPQILIAQDLKINWFPLRARPMSLSLISRSPPVWIISIFMLLLANRYLPLIQHSVGLLALHRGYRLMNLLEVLEERVAEAKEIRYRSFFGQDRVKCLIQYVEGLRDMSLPGP